MKILIVDDHSITRLGVSLSLKELYPDAQITEAHDESSAIHQLRRQIFDLMIFDVNMPGSDPSHLLMVAHDLNAAMRTLVFSMVSESTHGKFFLRKGADGFLNKDADNSLFKDAVQTVMAGNTYIPESLREESNKRSKKTELHEQPKLSFREIEVLRRLMEGHSLTDISAEMKLHISTISTYKTRIMQKMGVNSLLEIKDIPDFQI
jgi:DNA-binding NarL/FixJ family response regulator